MAGLMKRCSKIAAMRNLYTNTLLCKVIDDTFLSSESCLTKEKKKKETTD